MREYGVPPDYESALEDGVHLCWVIILQSISTVVLGFALIVSNAGAIWPSMMFAVIAVANMVAWRKWVKTYA